MRAFDFRVPVGSLDQSHHQATLVIARAIAQPVDKRQGASAIGLNDDAKPIPRFQRWLSQQGIQNVQRQILPIHLLGVDVQANAGVRRQFGQGTDARQEGNGQVLSLQRLVARTQCGELDGYTGTPVHRSAAVPAQRHNGVRVRQLVAARIIRGPRRFAQHVVGERVASSLFVTGARQGFLDRLAHYELSAHFTHGLHDGKAHDRFADAPKQGTQRATDTVCVARVQHAAGQHQRPGGSIHEKRFRVAFVCVPVCADQRGGNELIHRAWIRYAQQRFRQAHECYALVGGQAVLGKERLHDGGAVLLSDPGDETAGGLVNCRAIRTIQTGRLQQ
ncbi:MAG: hypothetical protein R3E84_14580 [Pseudomonadales bacterium]